MIYAQSQTKIISKREVSNDKDLNWALGLPFLLPNDNNQRRIQTEKVFIQLVVDIVFLRVGSMIILFY